MGQVADSPASDRSDSSPPADDKRLQGRRLALVRIAWGATALIGVGTFAARLPGHYADLQRVCVGPVCAYGQLGPSAAQSFQRSVSHGNLCGSTDWPHTSGGAHLVYHRHHARLA